MLVTENTNSKNDVEMLKFGSKHQLWLGFHGGVLSAEEVVAVPFCYLCPPTPIPMFCFNLWIISSLLVGLDMKILSF